MKRKVPYFVLAVSLMMPVLRVLADESGTNPVEHPVTAYHEYEVEGDIKNVNESAQEKTIARARLKRAKAKYVKTLKKSGPDSETTKDAQKKYDSAREEYKKYVRKHQDAHNGLRKDLHELNEDKATR